ncbi:MAG: insulinase family protein, partial [Gammaproteobacteria bacterium]
MKKPFAPAAVPALLALLALTIVPPPAAAQLDSPLKSPADRKHYRVLQLDNGLKVALVSDPAGDKAAASLDVHVGNGSDPENWQGLAHLLEHVLFLGSEKYPKADEYHAFISEHGGRQNAYTAFDHTNYYFEVSAEHLLPALERFSRFFIDPSFDATFIARERSVVHSEYQAWRKEDNRRVWTARRQLLNPAHPAARFSVGAEQTLRDRDGGDARRRLIEFYRRHYSADIMTLAVVGREPLDQLEAWTRGLFGEVTARGIKPPRFAMPYIERRAMRQDVAAQKDEMRALFFFPIPGTRAHYRTKPLGYIANLLGHEGEGSLLALLDKLGWADGLSAGAGHMDDAQGSFDVAVSLTKRGLARIDDIGEMLFQYIALIAEQGVTAWRYDEERTLAEIAFRFAEEHGARATALSLAPALHRYPSADALRGRFMMRDYRPQLMHELLTHLRPDNVLLQVLARDAPVTARTPFYDVGHTIRPIAPRTLAKWRAAAHGARDARLALPAANRFIPARLRPHAFPGAPAAVPKRLVIGDGGDGDNGGGGGDGGGDGDGDGLEAWHHPDAQFGTPRAAFFFSVMSPLAAAGAREMVLTELFVRMVNKRLDAPGYPARLAGLHYELFRHHRGFSARISGYEDRQPEMLAEVLDALFAPRFDPGQFKLVAAALQREWRNQLLEPPSNQSIHELYRLLLHPYWSEAERINALAGIRIGGLEAHAAKLLRTARLTTLAHGDVSAPRAKRMNRMLRAAFAGGTAPGEVAPPLLRKLKAGAYLRTLDVDHDDSALSLYFQGRDKSDAERAKMALLARMLESPFFSSLRTTHRVGYLVHALPFDVLDVPGLLLSVQSPTHAPAEIEMLVDAFLHDFAQQLKRMDARAFAQHKQGLLDRILARDENLRARTMRNWREIHRKRLDFASRRHLTARIKALRQADITAFFLRLTREHPRTLLVQSPGRRPQAQAAGARLGGGYTRTGNAA